MTMAAITNNYNLTDAVIKSIDAGSDLVLVCHGYEEILNSISAVKEAVINNILSEDKINKSVYRVLKLKEKYSIKNDKVINEIDIEGINSEINSLFY